MRYLKLTATPILAFALVLFLAACPGKQEQPDAQPTEPTESSMQSDSARTDADVVAEPVMFEAAGMKVFGTLTRPSGEGPFPAIAIAAGSGPTDRDWRNPLIPGPNGSAALLARDLSRRGIVVLRYDKRGTGETGMPAGSVGWDDYIAELSGALETLARKDFVDQESIHIAGHSEGGAHALKVAQNPPVPLASVVLLSTSGRSLRDIVVWQIGNQIKQSGLNPESQKAEIEALRNALDRIAAGEDVAPQSVGQLPGVHQFIGALQNPDSVEFARALLSFEPKEAFEGLDVPVLVLSGAKDIQVDPDLDAKPLAEAAKSAGVTTKLVISPDADHVLKYEETPREQLNASAGARYNAEDRTLAEDIGPTIADWIATQ